MILHYVSISSSNDKTMFFLILMRLNNLELPELLASFHVNVGDDDAVSPAEEKEKKKE